MLASGCTPGTCVVSGWGYTEQGGDLSKILRKVNVPIISDGDCQNNYKRKNKDISSHMLCAGYSSGGRDSCQVSCLLVIRSPHLYHARNYIFVSVCLSVSFTVCMYVSDTVCHCRCLCLCHYYYYCHCHLIRWKYRLAIFTYNVCFKVNKFAVDTLVTYRPQGKTHEHNIKM